MYFIVKLKIRLFFIIRSKSKEAVEKLNEISCRNLNKHSDTLQYESKMKFLPFSTNRAPQQNTRKNVVTTRCNCQMVRYI